MKTATPLVADHALYPRFEEIARKRLDFNFPQRDLSYEDFAQELEPKIAEQHKQRIRDCIAHWNRAIVHFIPKEATQAVCGWKRGTPDPVLDGRHKSLTPHYNTCKQEEACPECWRIESQKR